MYIQKKELESILREVKPIFVHEACRDSATKIIVLHKPVFRYQVTGINHGCVIPNNATVDIQYDRCILQRTVMMELTVVSEVEAALTRQGEAQIDCCFVDA